MSLQERIESLRSKHAAIDQTLQEELLSPASRPEEIARLKREKLRLKDEINRLGTPDMAGLPPRMNGMAHSLSPGA